MSHPAPSQRPMHRLQPGDEAQFHDPRGDESVLLDSEQTEDYLRWLETGEGPDPCADVFSE